MVLQWSSFESIAEEVYFEDLSNESPRVGTFTEITAVAGRARAINIERHRSSSAPQNDDHHDDDDDDDADASVVARTKEDDERRVVEDAAPRSMDGHPVDAIDEEAAKRLRWKIDLRMFPILFIVYTLFFLDRINISNAHIQGLAEDLELYGKRYNVVLFAYFIPYIVLEIPSNMILRKMRPSWYLSGLMFGWGIVNMSMGFVTTYTQLVTLRALLGALEAGVTPGIVYLTSMYYRRHELLVRISSLSCGIVVASAAEGFLAYAIADLDGTYAVRAWRWIFILEGAATALVSIAAAFTIADWPAQCRYLDAGEKALLDRILASDGADEARMDTLDGQAWRLILGDWKIWLASLVLAGTSVTGYAVVFVMPTILAEYGGWEARDALVHSVPVYGATVAAVVLVAWLSDRCRHRYAFIVLGCVVASVGYVLLLIQDALGHDATYAGLFLASAGGYAATPVAVAWLANNVSGHWKRALGPAAQLGLGNLAGLAVAANVFAGRDAPRYAVGYAVVLGLTGLAAAAATVMALALRAENRRRAAGGRDYRLCGRTMGGGDGGGRGGWEVRNLGDDHPSFRFTL